MGCRDAGELLTLWPTGRSTSKGGERHLRIFSNPKATHGLVRRPLVDFKVGFLNDIPIIWLVFSVVLILGAIYYFAVQRNKPYVGSWRYPPRRTIKMVPAATT